MKKTIVTAVILTSVIGFEACNNSTKTKTTDKDTSQTTVNPNDKNNSNSNQMNNDLMTAMNSSGSRMEVMKMTGDFDYDFANTMKEHHQSAIDMSQVELANGSDAQAKDWAQKISDAQKKEIADLDLFIKTYKALEAKEGAPTHNELYETMEKMMNDMKGMPMSGNTDKDFVMMMVAHHQSAIDMAKDELSHGKNAEMKKMAQNIISDQTKEIKDFRAWLESHK